MSNLQFINNFPFAKERINDGMRDNLLSATMEWHSGVVNDMLVGNRSGREYRLPGSNTTYQASSPGDAPASRTGRLRQSYQFRLNDRGGSLVGEVGSPLEYALHLEKGTKRMAPRPHVQPAFENRQNSIMELLGRTILE